MLAVALLFYAVGALLGDTPGDCAGFEWVKVLTLTNDIFPSGNCVYMSW